MHHVDHEGTFLSWPYASPTYNLINFREAKEATAKQQQGETDTDCKDDRVDGQLTTTCYKSKVWTFPITITTDDIDSIIVNGEEIAGYIVSQSGGNTIITFTDEMTYQSNADAPETSTALSLTLDKSSDVLGVTEELKGKFYDYSEKNKRIF